MTVAEMTPCCICRVPHRRSAARTTHPGTEYSAGKNHSGPRSTGARRWIAIRQPPGSELGRALPLVLASELWRKEDLRKLASLSALENR